MEAVEERHSGVPSGEPEASQRANTSVFRRPPGMIRLSTTVSGEPGAEEADLACGAGRIILGRPSTMIACNTRMTA